MPPGKKAQTSLLQFFEGNHNLPAAAIAYRRSMYTRTDQKRIAEYRRERRPDKYQVWRAYLFLATNNFSEYTIVTAIPRDVMGKIYEPCDKIGEASVDENSALTHIEIKEPFRQQGLGSELIDFIRKACPQFHVFAGNQHNSRYRLTDEGAILIASCRRRGILKDRQVILNYVPDSPSKTSVIVPPSP